MGVFGKPDFGLRSTPRWTWLLVAGALLTVVGLSVAATAPVLGTPGAGRTRSQQHVAGAFVVVGWVLLGAAIHSIGRAPVE